MSQKIKTSVEIDGSLTASQIANATTDTDKFLVSDGGTVKYRTGAELAQDLGISAGTTSKVQHQVKAGVAINKGQAVYVTSADGTNMIVGLASNASEATSSKTMGLLNATVAINGFADVITEGLLDGLNTIGANAGDPVWLGTGGNLIYGLVNKPYAPNHLVFIGIVTRVNANNGEIFVKVQNGFELDELHDVDLKTTTKVNGHLLGYNGSLWVNKTIAEWLGYTPYNASNPAGYISSYTETDTLASVTARGAATGTSITVGGVFTTKGTNPYIQWQNSAGTRLGYIQHATNLVMSSDTGNIEFTPSSGLVKTIGYIRYGGASAYSNTGLDSNGFYQDVNGTNIYESTMRLQSNILSGVSSYNGLKFGAAAIGNASEGFTIFTGGYDNNRLTINSSGNATFGVDARAPIFYDSNNTAYYVNPASATRLNGYLSFGVPGNGANANGRWLSIEGNTDVDGEGSGRIFFTEHNSTTAAMDAYGLSIGYRGGATSLTTAGGNTWTGLSAIDNGAWGFWGHNGDTTGTLAMFGPRTGEYITATGSFRAPIFYDSNDTSYYTNPASTSVLSSITLRGAAAISFYGAGSGTYNIGAIYSGTSINSWEAPLETDSYTAARVPFILTWRGGYAAKGGLKLTGDASGELGGNVILHAGNYSSYAVPTSRTITINGTSYDLSANRSWTVTGTETDTLASVTARGNTTSTGVGFNNYVDILNQNSVYWYNSGNTIAARTYFDGGTFNLDKSLWVTANIYGDVFYDRNNSAYYGDFASSGTSININGGIVTTAASGSVLLKHAVSEADAWIFQENASNWGLYWKNYSSGHHVFGQYTTVGAELVGMSAANASGNGVQTSNFTGATSAYAQWMMSNYTGYIWSASTMYAAGDMRAPGFYDSNDTSFYTDPASTSNLNKLRITSAGNSAGGNILMGPAGEGVGKWSYLTGTHYNATSQSKGVSIIGLYASASENAISIGGNIYEANPATEIRFYTHNAITHGTGGSVRMVINSAGNVEANVDMRAPIFYDYNNTGYYLDPNGSSNLANVTANEFYSNGWFRNNANNTGLYNQTNGNHIYSRGGTRWGVTGNSGSGNIYLDFLGNHENNYRGSVHVDTNSTIGFLTDNQGWGLRVTSNKSVYVHGTDLHINADNAGASNIYMNDGDEGSRTIHCNSNRIGFLNQSSSWGSWCEDNGSWRNETSMNSPIFYDYNDTGFYLDPNSTTNSLVVAGAIKHSGTLSRPSVQWGASGNVTGAVVIKLPGTAPGNYGMIHAVIDVYEYNSNNVCTITIGGHNWSSQWYNYGAQLVGNTNKPVRLAIKDGRYCIVLGNGSTVWEYGQVVLRKIQNGTYYNGVMDLGGAYSIGIESDSYSWVSEDLRKLTSSGYILSSSAMYSPIYYDNNDSGYYTNPASTSNLYDLNLSGPKHTYLTITPGNGYESMVRYVGGQGYSWYVGKRTSNELLSNENFHFYSEAAARTVAGVDTGGNIHAYSSVRAPEFFDSNNTDYYVNPAGVSKILAYNANRYEINVPGSYDGGYQWVAIDIGRFNAGGSSLELSISRAIWEPGPYGGCTSRFIIHSREWHSGQDNYWGYYTEHGSNGGASFPNGFYVSHAGPRDLAGGGYRFFMRLLNGVRYYLSASGDMNYTSAQISNPIYGVSDPGGVPVVKLGMSVNGANSTYNRIFSGNTIDADGIISSAADMRSPVFYDSTNTAYFFDGNSTGDSIRVAGDIVAYYSDERLKDKKGNIENALDKVLSLNGFHYTPNAKAQELGYKYKNEVGVSAQEVEAILPEIIKDAPIGQGYKTLDYGKLTPLLIEAIKEQQTQIEELKELINKLINK